MRKLYFIPHLVFALAFGLNIGMANAGFVCWKDASGKTIGCGDHVPPEYQGDSVDQRNKRGSVVHDESKPATLTEEQKKAAANEAQAQQAQAEQQRKDRALLNAFTNVCEIDDKFKRDSGLLKANEDTLNTNLQNNQDRQAAARKKSGGQETPLLQQLSVEADNLDQQIAQKQQQIDDLTKDYQATRQHFIDLRGDNPNDKSCTMH